ncbi:MAG: hypothetical protein GY858_01830, partial [Candidatus Omnitrophica bacterium]|nr:hypothetical protein [Candidatus Omnitrophota bacterium]
MAIKSLYRVMAVFLFFAISLCFFSYADDPADAIDAINKKIKSLSGIVGKLDIEAKKVNKIDELLRLTYQEINNLSLIMARPTENQESLRKELTQRTQQTVSLKAEQAQMNVQLISSKKELEQLRKEFTVLIDKRDEITLERNNLKQAVTSNAGVVSALDAEIEGLKEKTAILSKNADELENALTNNNDLSKKITADKIKLSSLKKEIDSLE